MFRSPTVPSAWITLALAVLVVPASSAHDVHIEGEVRVRYEGDDRSFLNNVDMEHGVYQRTRFSGKVENDQGAEVYIELQDSRIWGDEGATLTDTENVDLHQAWVRFEDLNIEGLEWILGRQELDYGAGRVFSQNDWSNVGRSFDAIRAHMEFDSQWVDLAFAKVSEDGATGIDENVGLFVWHLDLEESGIELEPLLIYKENNAIDQYLTSVGNHGRLKRDRVKLYQDFLYQSGKLMGHDAKAMLFDATLLVDLSSEADEGAGLGGGFALQTGDDPADADDSAYDNLFWDDHKYHGYLDLAQPLTDGFGGAGLRDVFGKGWVKMDSGWWLKGAVHVFKTDVDVPLPSGAGDGNSLGTEFDIVIGKDLDSGVSAQVGAGVFSPGDLVSEFIGDENAAWVYAQGTARF